jgi:hypothetical protein
MGVCVSSFCVVCGCVVCVCACVQTNVVDEEARKRMDETFFIFDRIPEKDAKNHRSWLAEEACCTSYHQLRRHAGQSHRASW